MKSFSFEIVYDAVCEDFWIYVNGHAEGFAATESEAQAKAAEIVARFERHQIEHALQVQAALDVHCPDFYAPVMLEVVPVKVRCPFYREIRRFFAIARDNGLNTKNDDAIRDALAKALNRNIQSRDELNGADWSFAGDMVKMGVLTW